MYRRKCGLCQVGDLNMFLDLGATPLADRFPSKSDEEEERFPLRVAMCERCKLVQLQDIVPDDVLYNDDYAFYTGASSSHNPYWAAYANYLANRFGERHRTVLEVACNDGSLLTRLADKGFEAVGIDPATGPTSKIPPRIPVLREMFDAIGAVQVLKDHPPFDLVVANNVLAHVSDLLGFVSALDKVTHRDSVIVLEVQYLGDLVTGNQFDHFYHEHRSFFSLRTLQRLFLSRGFTIFDVTRTQSQGGSLRVFLSKGSKDYPVTDNVLVMLAGEGWLDEWFVMEAMAGRVDHIRDVLLEELETLREFPKLVAGYGATAKSCTLLNYCGIDSSMLEWVVDTTPWKWGKYTPGSKIPVLAPDDEPTRPDAYLLLAWNYLSGILRHEPKFLRDGGQFLVPLPKPVIL